MGLHQSLRALDADLRKLGSRLVIRRGPSAEALRSLSQETGAVAVYWNEISWAEGARWFWDTLVDADLANNTLGWQWVAGCGADAAPYFRIFNPVTQGQQFDPQGTYLRRWVRELEHLPEEWIHAPWQAPATLSRRCRFEGPKAYPRPIVSHAIAREVALEAYAHIRKAG